MKEIQFIPRTSLDEKGFGKCNICDEKASLSVESFENAHRRALKTDDTTELKNLKKLKVLNELSFPENDVTQKLLEAGQVDILEKENCAPTEKDMKLLKNDDPTNSLPTGEESPMHHVSSSSLNKEHLYSAKKLEEVTLLHDELNNPFFHLNLLKEGLVKVKMQELVEGQIELEKCNASDESNTEVFHEALPLPKTVVKHVASLYPRGQNACLKTLENFSVDISEADGNRALASTVEMMREGKLVDHLTTHDFTSHHCSQNSGILPNLLKAGLARGIVIEINVESVSDSCQNELKNDSNGQDQLLQVYNSPAWTSVDCSRRKLLVLDVNGLLVDIVHSQSNLHKPDIRIYGGSVYKRPFCEHFLKFCFERFDVGVWSSRMRKRLDAIINFLMGDLKNKLVFCWDQSKCTITGFRTIEDRKKPLFLKELKKLWDKESNLPWEMGKYTASNTLLVDDSPYKALRNPPYTAIFPTPYDFKNEQDDSLGPRGDLRVYLEGLAESDYVPSYVQKHPFGQPAITSKHPFWPFYLKIAEGVDSSGC